MLKQGIKLIDMPYQILTKSANNIYTVNNWKFESSPITISKYTSHSSLHFEYKCIPR